MDRPREFMGVPMDYLKGPNSTEPLTAAMAMSLYQYNVAPIVRAQKLFDHFRGSCAEVDELMRLADDKNWATAMAAPTAAVYLQHAIEKYGIEAHERVSVNMQEWWT
jgi:hypothetical protein